MKIERLIKKCVRFGDVKPGAVFDMDGAYYIKTDIYQLEIYAVELRTGKICKIVDPGRKVFPVNAKLVVDLG